MDGYISVLSLMSGRGLLELLGRRNSHPAEGKCTQLAFAGSIETIIPISCDCGEVVSKLWRDSKDKCHLAAAETTNDLASRLI